MLPPGETDERRRHCSDWPDYKCACVRVCVCVCVCVEWGRGRLLKKLQP